MANIPLGCVYQHRNVNNANNVVSIPAETLQGGFVVDGAISGFATHGNESLAAVKDTVTGFVGDVCETSQFDSTKEYVDGATLYWDATASLFTNVSTDNTAIGQSVGAAAAGAASIRFIKTRD